MNHLVLSLRISEPAFLILGQLPGPQLEVVKKLEIYA